jgi:guanylate kinase
MFVKTTTRPPRLGETNGIDYHFVADEAFDRLVTSGKLVHVTKSDFDTSRYGVDREQLDQVVGRGRGPIFSCHSVAEAKTLTEYLEDCALSTVCVYVYATENDRRRVLMAHAQPERFEARRETDLRFKRDAYASNFAGCNYLVLNAYDEDAVARIDAIVSEVESNKVAHACDWAYAQESVESDLRQESAAQTKPAWGAPPAPPVEDGLRSKRP